MTAQRTLCDRSPVGSHPELSQVTCVFSDTYVARKDSDTGKSQVQTRRSRTSRAGGVFNPTIFGITQRIDRVVPKLVDGTDNTAWHES